MLRAIYYVKRWAWFLILCPILAGGGTFGLAKVVKATQPPTYEATIRLIFGLANPGGPGYLTSQVASQLQNTYSTLLQNPTVLQDAARQLNLNETPDQLAKQIHISSQSGNIIAVQADASTSDGATNLASAVVLAFNHVAAKLPVVAGRGQDIAPVGSATVTTVASSKLSSSTAAIAALIGLVIAASVVALLYYLDDTIFQPEEVARVDDVAVLSAPLPERRRAAADQGDADATTRLLLASLRASVTCPAVLFCAWASERDRDPGAVLRLAETAARSGLRVALLNTDSRYHWLADLCGVPEDVGLANALLSAQPILTPYIIPLATPGLAVMPAGQAGAETTALLDSTRLDRLIAPLRQYIDLAFITGVPVLDDPAAAALTRVSDGVLFMATARRSRRRELRDALVVLRRVRARVLGLALEPPPESLPPVKEQTPVSSVPASAPSPVDMQKVPVPESSTHN
jgi:succinoglycan biosynthesis transport protein ExoP